MISASREIVFVSYEMEIVSYAVNPVIEEKEPNKDETGFLTDYFASPSYRIYIQSR
jgi:hypothetical protein